MEFTYAQYRESADAVRTLIGDFTPDVAMILGSGLGYLGDEVENAVAVPYGQIPHFRVSTAPGHKGQLVLTQPAALVTMRVSQPSSLSTRTA